MRPDSSYPWPVNGANRWASVWVLAQAALACSAPEAERSRHVRSIDRVNADAEPRPSDSGPSDSSPVDAAPIIDASTVDALDYYCSFPEPGPCCCNPKVLEIRAPEAGSSFACDFVIAREGRGSRVDPNKINLVAIDSSSAESVLPYTTECSADAPGWLVIPGDPPVGQLCPVTCQAIASGEYVAIRAVQGCHLIACPPP
jgi:hypothetical protein